MVSQMYILWSAWVRQLGEMIKGREVWSDRTVSIHYNIFWSSFHVGTLFLKAIYQPIALKKWDNTSRHLDCIQFFIIAMNILMFFCNYLYYTSWNLGIIEWCVHLNFSLCYHLAPQNGCNKWHIHIYWVFPFFLDFTSTLCGKQKQKTKIFIIWINSIYWWFILYLAWSWSLGIIAGNKTKAPPSWNSNNEQFNINVEDGYGEK